jgi:hypothetical protein
MGIYPCEGKIRNIIAEWDPEELSAAEPQPKKFYWTQINTDFISAKDLKTKDISDTDERG